MWFHCKKSGKRAFNVRREILYIIHSSTYRWVYVPRSLSLCSIRTYHPCWRYMWHIGNESGRKDESRFFYTDGWKHGNTLCSSAGGESARQWNLEIDFFLFLLSISALTHPRSSLLCDDQAHSPSTKKSSVKNFSEKSWRWWIEFIDDRRNLVF